ncbi:MAG: ATP-binding protein, partial [Candidatus Hydrogenedentes bacterium]|nr:ATP-binding protein [Candidatus Hydrogenedentota bacterium]
IISHGLKFPQEAPPDLVNRGDGLCASCHSPLLPVELSTDLLEVPPNVAVDTGRLRAYSRGKGLILEVTVPVSEGKSGLVRVGVGDRMIRRDLASVNRSILMGLGLCLLASVCSALVVTYVLNKPIRALLHATHRVREGDFDARAPVFSGDEIGRLSVAFNRMAEGLAESRRRVLRADKLASIGEFAAGVAHEINNPLDGVMSCLSRLQRDPANLSQNMEYLQMIQHALKRISTVIQRLLEYSRASEMSFQPEDVNHIIENVIALIQVMAKQNAIHIIFDYGKDVPLVAGDCYHLEQALLNLAHNAVAAMPPGGTLTFRTRPAAGRDDRPGRVEISVEDTGAGIAKENLDKVFEPFFTTKDPGKGTGLGLAIVKEIVEAHSGEVHVDSTLGVGSTFRVYLPAATDRGEANAPEQKVSA